MGQATAQRRQRILSELVDRNHVSVNGLSEALEVSAATIRRDLRALSRQRHVTLVHGGATLAHAPDAAFFARHLRNLDAKRVIGQLAADLVGDEDQIFLDSGTTCFAMAPFLRWRRKLSVVLNSARLALELTGPGLSLIMLGGQYRPERMDTVGAITSATLEQLRGYVAFIGADGLSMDFGPAANDVESAHLYRLAAAHARQTVLLVDHTKFQAASLFKIVEWNSIHRLVTDQPPAPSWMTFLHEYRIEVIFPEDGSQETEIRSQEKAIDHKNLAP